MNRASRRAGEYLRWFSGERQLLCVVLLLAALGIASAIGRAVFVSDWVIRGQVVRADIVRALQLDESDLAQRAELAQTIDARYAANPLTTYLHVIPGALLLLVAPLQFSPELRRRYTWWHRWAGRTLLVGAIAVGLSGLYFGVLVPFAGPAEAITIAIVATAFFASLARAYRAIRRREIASHREWMIRAFAIALGISTVRVYAAIIDLTLSSMFDLRHLFVLSLWAGWLTTLAGAEAWIRRTRRHV